MSKKGLIIIDIQNDYFEGGNFPLVNTVEAVNKANVLLSEFRKNRLPVIHIQHINTKPGASFFIPETEGVQINENVKPLGTEKIILKHFPNSFRDTELLSFLKQESINDLVICGMQTNMCVDATVRAACDLGFSCTVISDACAAANLEYNNIKVNGETVHVSFLAALKMAYARVVKLEEYSI